MAQSHVAANVRAEMARRGTTQLQIAALLDTSRESVRRRLHGTVTFRIDELQKIAQYLDIPLLDLVDDEKASA